MPPYTDRILTGSAGILELLGWTHGMDIDSDLGLTLYIGVMALIRGLASMIMKYQNHTSQTDPRRR